MGIGYGFQSPNKFHNLGKVALCILGQYAPKVALRNVGMCLKLTTQNATSDWAVGYDSDTQFATCAENIGFFDVQCE